MYVIHGDEPLLAMEAGDAIRAAARKAGCDEREVLVAEKGFDWDAFRATNANLGLFGSRKLIDLRIPSGKPGVDGARALEASVAGIPNPDSILLVTLPKLALIATDPADVLTWTAILFVRTADPTSCSARTSSQEVCIMRFKAVWIVLIALVLTTINTVPALAATGVVWGS